MKQQADQKPLWRRLNEKRKPGIWVVFSWAKKDPFYKVHDGSMEVVADVYGDRDKDLSLANAEYISLAVNNLHKLAEALEGVIRVADRKTDEFDQAKAALKNIS